MAWCLPKVVLKKHRKGQRKGPRTTTMFVVSPHEVSLHGLSMDRPSKSQFRKLIAVLQNFSFDKSEVLDGTSTPKRVFLTARRFNLSQPF